MNKEKIKSAIEKTIRYMNGNYYSKFEEKMIVGYLEGALKELEDNMTKQEAMAFAISVGKPIKHNSFSKGEFVRYKGKELVDEEGTILPQQEFWAIRSGGSWERGWEEYKNDWTEMKEIEYSNNIEYRIKPESKYRPFKNAEECWQEMQKHQPFGWVKSKEDGSRSLITLIISEENIDINCIGGFNSDKIMKRFTFDDGAVFGILEEE